MLRLVQAALAVALGSAGVAQSAPPIDPLTARVDDNAARRFASMWRATGGKPSAEQIQAQYLNGSGRAIEVFTPGRITSAERLAKVIAANPQLYGNAVERCLPWVEGTNAQLRASYLGLKGLFPEKPLPEIAVVVGANNSGGTAAAGIQVIGLEVICRLSPDQAAFERSMRQFFAHETVHTLQKIGSPKAMQHMLLTSALAEGVPDLVTKLITASTPAPERDLWARQNQSMIWSEFRKDMAIVQAGTDANGTMDAKAQAAFGRWIGNAGSPPEGWPDELGYWVGMRIAEDYLARADDQRGALEELLHLEDPQAILARSGFGAGA